MSRATLHLRPWRPGDLDAFDPRPDMAAEGAAARWDWSKGPPGPTWSLIRFPDQVIGIGGGLSQGRRLVPGVDDHGAEGFPRGDWAHAILCAATVIRHLEKVHGAEAADRAGAARISRRGERTMEKLGFSRWSEGRAASTAI